MQSHIVLRLRSSVVMLLTSLICCSLAAKEKVYSLPPPLPFVEAEKVIRACAPKVAPSTMAAVTNHESRWRPYTIAINGTIPPAWKGWQPKQEQTAVKAAKKLIAAGYDFDMGFAQINVRNLGRPILRDMGITVENIFDTCTNVRAAEAILVECYSRARLAFSDRRAALDAALSCYNTGNFVKGKRNGYVGKVYAAQVKGLR